ncbi:hypothetical protein EM20IM_04115 [Candidatus Methylacidiphilum infernorum]|uniref:Uncharacterized protein n=1 Tax=Candidatus Methylacidiphilum infernorum TaxID=511746 RepID=A0ABX7PWZ1_9BACT|nr:hypothetical protein [Candidatus Methylacidiphilum infernorum]QSR87514.1 hypothetical protein EM20IM_04115 [Candidatus Methylacidiphilum infernorum]
MIGGMASAALECRDRFICLGSDQQMKHRQGIVPPLLATHTGAMAGDITLTVISPT